MSKPFVGIYAKVGDIGVQQTFDICNRAKDYGYNGLCGWWNNHARPQPNDSDKRDALWLGEQLAGIGFSLIVQTAYTGDFVGDTLGDSSIMESNGAGDPECCLADDRVFDVWRQWAERFRDWHPTAVGALFSYDEIRRGGSHSACRQRQQQDSGYGPMLADHLKRAAALYREVVPGVTILPFNDMFDPAVNAHPGDYQGDGYNIRGGFSRSWDGVDTEMVIANWSTNGNDEESESFPWWAQRGNKQLYLGYYDYNHNDYGDGIPADQEADWIARELAASPGSICGYVFTTWNQDNTAWSNLKRYAPSSDLIAGMAPFPADGTVTPPTPDPVPVPPPTPDPLAADLAEMDGLIERVQTRGIRAKQRTVFGRIKAEIAAKAKAA